MDVGFREHTSNSMFHFSYICINILHQLSTQKIPFPYDHLYQILFLNEQRDREESFLMQLIPKLKSNLIFQHFKNFKFIWLIHSFYIDNSILMKRNLLTTWVFDLSPIEVYPCLTASLAYSIYFNNIFIIWIIIKLTCKIFPFGSKVVQLRL